MGGTNEPLIGPDFSAGVDRKDVEEGGSLLGHALGERVLLVRQAGEVFAVGARCTHYGGPLAEGLITEGQVRCPWHHACFDLRTGEASAPPALDPIPCWKVNRSGSRLVLGERVELARRPTPPRSPENVIIVGAGAAGSAAAETLRRQGYAGPITMIGAEDPAPVDRPNLSKDYLAGSAPEEWTLLRGRDFYAARRIELVLGVRVVSLEPRERRIELSDGRRRNYGALLLATGADPVKLPIPGGDKPHVHTLRSLADSKAIMARAREGARAVVVGASFIGLEVAAALRTRGVDVRVVAPEARPLERVLGPELGDFVRNLHEEHGVCFHLRHTLKSVEDRAVVLDDGTSLAADFVVAGIGVRPSLALAEKAGLRVDRGVLVDELLETSAPGVHAAGDIARWPDARTGRPIRIEHWVVAERQGQTAARNMLGMGEPFRAVPFFWSQHYDVPIAYVGYGEGWDRVDVAGSISERNCLVAFRVGGRIAAIASIYRDKESLQAEQLFERGDDEALEALFSRAGRG